MDLGTVMVNLINGLDKNFKDNRVATTLKFVGEVIVIDDVHGAS